MPNLDRNSLRRHLIYELVPSRGLDWRGPFNQLLKRIDLFDGERLVAVSSVQFSETLSDVRELLKAANCEIVHLDADPVAGKSRRFWNLLRELSRTVHENDIVWHGEYTAESQVDPPDFGLAHRLCLSDLDAIHSSIDQMMIAGPLLAQRDPDDTTSWYFHGSCYWFRAAALFHRYHNNLLINGLNSETWPCMIFDHSEAQCLTETTSSVITVVSHPADRRSFHAEPEAVQRCDIIITCHNYGHFLAECLNSVKRQPSELIGQILVVDDSSTDDTASVTKAFGIPYMRVDVQDPHLARSAGFGETSAPLVLFLDADNLLAEGYLRCALDRFAHDTQLALVYMDLQYFGDATDRVSMPRKFSLAALSQSNFLDTGCIVRREAMDQAHAFRQRPCQRDGLEDWYMWRRLFESGNWRAEWQPVPLLYRRHGNQRLKLRHNELRGVKNRYFVDAALGLETITLFTTFSKRVRQSPALWDRRLEWIEKQDWPRDQLRICIANTSHESILPADLKLERLAGFAGISIYDHPVGVPGLEDADRRQEDIERQVQSVVAAIYNRMLREVHSQWCLILEDDVFPQKPELIETLLSSVEADTIAVAGAYQQRYCNAWSTWDVPAQLHKERGKGVVEIGGSGFGCLLLRLSQCRDDLFQGNTRISRYYDVDFFVRARQRGLRAKVDWSVLCDHVEPPI